MLSNKSRVVLYSHDTQGLGHMRRNLAIATALITAHPQLNILLITGSPEINAFTLPAGIDCVTLPALGKNEQGHYQPRALTISQPHLTSVRANIILAAIKGFAPDVLIADKVPLGLFGELEPSLAWLRSQPQARCVLGLREILDDPATVRREWQQAGNDAAIQSYYDAIWVYGDPRVYDPVRAYDLSPTVAAKVRYTGYLDRPSVSPPQEAHPLLDREFLAGPLALCLVGGGQDGYELATAFLQAELPAGMRGLVVTGPFMPAEAWQCLQDQAAERPHQYMLPFVTNPEALLRRAERVITMGGYNTVCELLSLEKQALIVPRVKPRLEQLIRAERLAELGLLDYLHPARLTPAALSAWLAGPPAPPTRIRDRVDLNGLSRLPGLLEQVLANPAAPSFMDRSPRWTPLVNRFNHLLSASQRTFSTLNTPKESAYVTR